MDHDLEVTNMGDVRLTLRRATPEEVRAEQRSNAVDLWYQEPLDLDARTVARAANSLWGPPVPGGTDGESLWKLWDEASDSPAYIAIGVLPPAVLFSDGMYPDGGDDLRLRDEIRRMLVEAGGEAAAPVG